MFINQFWLEHRYEEQQNKPQLEIMDENDVKKMNKQIKKQNKKKKKQKKQKSKDNEESEN